MTVRNWRDCPVALSHGNIVERTIFTRIELRGPAGPGAVLSVLKSFSRGWIDVGTTPEPTTHRDEQEVLYVCRGTGIITCDGQDTTIREGSAVLIPAGLRHSVICGVERPLELLRIVDEVPREAVGEPKGLVVRNYHEVTMGGPWHWAHLGRTLLGTQDGLVSIRGGIGHITIPPMSIAEPHPGFADADEVWYQLRGTSLLFLGQSIRWQREGDAAFIPAGVNHSSINHTDEPMEWLYFFTGVRS